MKLIDADALKEYIDCGHLRDPGELCFSEIDVVELIDAQPTVKAVPVKRGKWIEKSTGGEYFDRCSECGYIEWGAPNNYCPECGCRMDVE